MITSRGIKVGDSFDKVIETYGKPTIAIDIGKDKLVAVLIEDLNFTEGRVLRYITDKPDELFVAEFYFNEKGLYSLLISESE